MCYYEVAHYFIMQVKMCEKSFGYPYKQVFLELIREIYLKLRHPRKISPIISKSVTPAHQGQEVEGLNTDTCIQLMVHILGKIWLDSSSHTTWLAKPLGKVLCTKTYRSICIPDSEVHLRNLS